MRWCDLFIQKEVHLTEKKEKISRFEWLERIDGHADVLGRFVFFLFSSFLPASLIIIFVVVAFSLAYCQYLLAFSGVS